MTKLWMFTCESCERKTATECDMFDAADVRCAMCGSALVGDKVDVVTVSSERLAALESIYEATKTRRKALKHLVTTHGYVDDRDDSALSNLRDANDLVDEQIKRLEVNE